MQRSPKCSPSLGASDFGNPIFNVLIAYEDFDTGKQARSTYEFLAENLGHECQFANQMWKFDVLGIPKLREIAARDAAAADIIIISCHGTTELPVAVKAWLELWLDEKTEALALVALLDYPFGQTSEARALRSYLADIARRAGIEFFAQPDGWPGVKPEIELMGPERAGHASDRTPSTLAGVVQRDPAFPRWGINE